MPRTLVIAAQVAVLGLWLAGCGSMPSMQSENLAAKTEGSDAFAAAPADNVSVDAAGAPKANAGLLGSNPADDLSEGKKYFRSENYGMAERYFRRAVEVHPKDAEAWIGLAATYDHLRRFDFADRAYNEAIRLVGPTVEILNNQGYSYMLRGDTKRAREKLLAAQRKDPGNPFVQNNLALLARSTSQAKAVE